MIVCGIDEAGRGPLAGPVISAAVVLPAFFSFDVYDSKSLTPKKREKIFFKILSVSRVGIGWATREEIDSMNILNASLLAMKRALYNLPVMPDIVLIDGNKTIPGINIKQEAIIKGDKTVPQISAASIVAKVIRDEIMQDYAKRYPNYSFDKHKGYPTKLHVSAVKEYGVLSIHRRTFSPIKDIIDYEKERKRQ